MQTTTPVRPEPARPRTYAPWGMLAAIDLHDGDRARLADPDTIRRFVPEVIDEVFGRCFVDVFSCKPFDPEIAAAIAAEHFDGTPTVTVLQR